MKDELFPPFTLLAQESGGDLFRPVLFEQRVDHGALALMDGAGEGRVCQQAGIVQRIDFVSRGRRAPGRFDPGIAQQAFHAAAGLRCHDQRADALASGPASPAGTVQQRGRIARQVCVDDETQIVEVEATRSSTGVCAKRNSWTALPSQIQPLKTV